MRVKKSQRTAKYYYPLDKSREFIMWLATNYNILFNFALQFINAVQSSVKNGELCAMREI